MTKGLSDKLVNAYYEYMVDVAVLFGADKERAAEELKESLLFEIKLANVSFRMSVKRFWTWWCRFLRFPCRAKNDVTPQHCTTP